MQRPSWRKVAVNPAEKGILETQQFSGFEASVHSSSVHVA